MTLFPKSSHHKEKTYIAETPILCPPDVKNWLIGKDPDAGKDWGQEKKWVTEDEMVGWYHWLALGLCSLVAKSCPALCDPMDCSTSGLPVLHYLPEFAQTHVHQVGDTVQPSHPLLSPSPPACSLSQHLGLFRWVSSSHQVAKVLEII